jgi:hypothetical protein
MHPLQILKPPVEIPGFTYARAGMRSTAMIPVTAGCAMRLSMLPKKRKQMKSASKLAQWQIRVDKIAEFSEGSREDAVK